jgi:hypothetical protein
MRVEHRQAKKTRSVLYSLTALLVLFVSSLGAETWTLWAKIELFGLDSAGNKIASTFWDRAGETKDDSSFQQQGDV